MKHRTIFALLIASHVLIFGFAILFAAAAHADTGAIGAMAVGTKVDFHGIADMIVDGLFSVVGAVVLAVLRVVVPKYLKKIGFESDAAAGAILDVALQNGLAKGQAQVHHMIDQPGALTVDLRNHVVAVAATYALDRAPEVIEHFGITPDSLKDMALARLGHLDPELANGTQVSPVVTEIPPPLFPAPASAPVPTPAPA